MLQEKLQQNQLVHEQRMHVYHLVSTLVRGVEVAMRLLLILRCHLWCIIKQKSSVSTVTASLRVRVLSVCERTLICATKSDSIVLGIMMGTDG